VEPLKLGMIGVGQMGSAHTRTMAPLEEVRVVAVADVDAARARAVGEAVGARAFADAHALIRRGGVEAVLIATPHTLHAPLALYAAKRGVHVLSEKPLAISAAAADRVIATCRDHGILLGVMFQQRTDPSWGTIKRLVEGGAVGAVYRLSLVTTAYRPQACRVGGGRAVALPPSARSNGSCSFPASRFPPLLLSGVIRGRDRE